MPSQRQCRLSPFGYFYSNIQQWTPAKVAILQKREALACTRQWGVFGPLDEQICNETGSISKCLSENAFYAMHWQTKTALLLPPLRSHRWPICQDLCLDQIGKGKGQEAALIAGWSPLQNQFQSSADAPINPTAARDPWGAAQPRVTLVVGAGAGASGHGEVGGFEYTMLAIFCSTVGVRGKSRWLTPLISFSSKW